MNVQPVQLPAHKSVGYLYESTPGRAARLRVDIRELPPVDRIKQLQKCGGATAATMFLNMKNLFGGDLPAIDKALASAERCMSREENIPRKERIRIVAECALDEFYSQKPCWSSLFQSFIVDLVTQGVPLFEAVTREESHIRSACANTNASPDLVVKKMYVCRRGLYATVLECHYGMNSAADIGRQSDWFKLLSEKIIENARSGKTVSEAIAEEEASIFSACLNTNARPDEVVRLMVRTGSTVPFSTVLEDHYRDKPLWKKLYQVQILELINQGKTVSQAIFEVESPLRAYCEGTSARMDDVLKLVDSGIALQQAVLDDHYRDNPKMKQLLGNQILAGVQQGRFFSDMISELDAPIRAACKGTKAVLESVAVFMIDGKPLMQAVVYSHFTLRSSYLVQSSQSSTRAVVFCERFLSTVGLQKTLLQALQEFEKWVLDACQGTGAIPDRVVDGLATGLPISDAVIEAHYGRLSNLRQYLKPKIDEKCRQGCSVSQAISEIEAPFSQLWKNSSRHLECLNHNLSHTSVSLAVVGANYLQFYQSLESVPDLAKELAGKIESGISPKEVFEMFEHSILEKVSGQPVNFSLLFRASNDLSQSKFLIEVSLGLSSIHHQRYLSQLAQKVESGMSLTQVFDDSKLLIQQHYQGTLSKVHEVLRRNCMGYSMRSSILYAHYRSNIPPFRSVARECDSETNIDLDCLVPSLSTATGKSFESVFEERVRSLCLGTNATVDNVIQRFLNTGVSLAQAVIESHFSVPERYCRNTRYLPVEKLHPSVEEVIISINNGQSPAVVIGRYESALKKYSSGTDIDTSRLFCMLKHVQVHQFPECVFEGIVRVFGSSEQEPLSPYALKMVVRMKSGEAPVNVLKEARKYVEQLCKGMQEDRRHILWGLVRYSSPVLAILEGIFDCGSCFDRDFSGSLRVKMESGVPANQILQEARAYVQHLASGTSSNIELLLRLLIGTAVQMGVGKNLFSLATSIDPQRKVNDCSLAVVIWNQRVMYGQAPSQAFSSIDHLCKQRYSPMGFSLPSALDIILEPLATVFDAQRAQFRSHPAWKTVFAATVDKRLALQYPKQEVWDAAEGEVLDACKKCNVRFEAVVMNISKGMDLQSAILDEYWYWLPREVRLVMEPQIKSALAEKTPLHEAIQAAEKPFLDLCEWPSSVSDTVYDFRVQRMSSKQKLATTPLKDIQRQLYGLDVFPFFGSGKSVVEAVAREMGKGLSYEAAILAARYQGKPHFTAVFGPMIKPLPEKSFLEVILSVERDLESELVGTKADVDSVVKYMAGGKPLQDAVIWSHCQGNAAAFSVFKPQVKALLSKDVSTTRQAIDIVQRSIDSACQNTKARPDVVIQHMASGMKLFEAALKDHYRDTPAYVVVLGEQILKDIHQDKFIVQGNYNFDPLLERAIATAEAPFRSAFTGTGASIELIMQAMSEGKPLQDAVIWSHCKGNSNSYSVFEPQVKTLLAKGVGTVHQAIDMVQRSIDAACKNTKARPDVVIQDMASGMTLFEAALKDHYRDTPAYAKVLGEQILKTIQQDARIAQGDYSFDPLLASTVTSVEAQVHGAFSGTKATMDLLMESMAKGISRDASIIALHYQANPALVSDHSKRIQDLVAQGKSLEKAIAEAEVELASFCKGLKARPQEVAQYLVQGKSLVEALVWSHYSGRVNPDCWYIKRLIHAMREGSIPANSLLSEEASIRSRCDTFVDPNVILAEVANGKELSVAILAETAKKKSEIESYCKGKIIRSSAVMLRMSQNHQTMAEACHAETVMIEACIEHKCRASIVSTAAVAFFMAENHFLFCFGSLDSELYQAFRRAYEQAEATIKKDCYQTLAVPADVIRKMEKEGKTFEKARNESIAEVTQLIREKCRGTEADESSVVYSVQFEKLSITDAVSKVHQEKRTIRLEREAQERRQREIIEEAARREREAREAQEREERERIHYVYDGNMELTYQGSILVSSRFVGN